MTNKTQSVSPSAAISAIESNLARFIALADNWPAARTRIDPEIVWAISPVPFYTLNNIIAANLPEASLENSIESVVALGQTQQVPLIWWIGPSTKPATLRERLEQHGFMHAATTPGMALDLLKMVDDPAPAIEHFKITKVDNTDALQILNQVSAQGIDLPEYAAKATFDMLRSISSAPQSPLHHYVGWLNDTPVASTSMLLDLTIAGIYNVVTLPEARKRGIGSAMTRYALKDARLQGAQMGILHSSPHGVHVYQGLGFETFCQFELFLWGSQFIQS